MTPPICTYFTISYSKVFKTFGVQHHEKSHMIQNACCFGLLTDGIKRDYSIPREPLLYHMLDFRSANYGIENHSSQSYMERRDLHKTAFNMTAGKILQGI